MAEDRPLLTTEEEVATLRAEFEDYKRVMNSRLNRPPTGTFAAWLGTSIPEGALLCNGQAVSRTDYADLWAWAQAEGTVGTVFGTGDGSTTFNVPNAAGRVLVGVGTLGGNTYSLGQTGGSATVTLVVANLPAHNHGVQVPQHGNNTHTVTGNTSGAGQHGHSGSTNNAGGHGGHNSGSSNVTQSGSGVTLPGNYGAGGGDHTHSININENGNHEHGLNATAAGASAGTHNVSENSVGSSTPCDAR